MEESEEAAAAETKLLGLGMLGFTCRCGARAPEGLRPRPGELLNRDMDEGGILGEESGEEV